MFPWLPRLLGGAVQGHRFAPLAIGAGMMASCAVIGMALGSVGSALQVDADTVFTAGTTLPSAFALLLGAMGVALLKGAGNGVEARVVER